MPSLEPGKLYTTNPVCQQRFLWLSGSPLDPFSQREILDINSTSILLFVDFVVSPTRPAKRLPSGDDYKIPIIGSGNYDLDTWIFNIYLRFLHNEEFASIKIDFFQDTFFSLKYRNAPIADPASPRWFVLPSVANSIFEERQVQETLSRLFIPASQNVDQTF